MDPARTWTYDRSHYPEPLTPMSASLWLWAMGEGMQAACRELGAPFGGFDTATAGHWAYESEVAPDWPVDAAAFEERCLGVAERWESELRERADAATAELRAMRPERPDAAGAVALLDRLVELVADQWHVHFLVVLGVHVAREALAERYAELLGGDRLAPYRLLEGLPNVSLDADEALWAIAERCRALDVADLVLELPAADALAALARLQHGREVLGELVRYGLEWGARSRHHELADPRYAERPEILVESLRLFLEHPRDLPAERATRSAERERLAAETLAAIPAGAERTTFARLLARVEAAAPLEEGHTLHIDQRGLQAVREALLGFGARLVAQGRLDRAEDVFLLDRAELRAALADDHGRGLQRLVRRRRRELEEAALLTPELVLGAPAPPAEPDPLFEKFYGTPGAVRRDGDVLHGHGASAGRAEGPARVVRGPAEFGRVQPGDVLVCTTTTPSWTPVFPALAGLVTDTGGILCHAAVVAREYGLPAVVGTEAATAAIRDGQRVALDGETGEVWIVSSS